MKEMKEKKRENLKYCLRYQCKSCPRWKQCEKENNDNKIKSTKSA